MRSAERDHGSVSGSEDAHGRDWRQHRDGLAGLDALGFTIARMAPTMGASLPKQRRLSLALREQNECAIGQIGNLGCVPYLVAAEEASLMECAVDLPRADEAIRRDAMGSLPA